MIDINTIQELLVHLIWLVPVCTGIVQVIKVTVASDSFNRFIPLLSVCVGIILGLVVLGLSVVGFFAGLLVGLTASGFYDLGKKTLAGG